MQKPPKPFNDKEKAYILANCEKMTIRQLESNLKQQDFCLLYGDLYSKILSFLKRKKVDFKRENLSIYYQNNITERELEVLDLMSKGFSDEEIAKQLNIALATIKTHIAAISDKIIYNCPAPHVYRVQMVLWYLKNIKKMEIDYDRK